MKKLTALLLTLFCILGLIGCTAKEDNNAPTYVVDIWEETEEDQPSFATALEKFYENETTEYYFSSIKSQCIMVRDNNGRTVDIVTALNEGLATIADLDYYKIKYYTKQKDSGDFKLSSE